jgi:hypothetical protein
MKKFEPESEILASVPDGRLEEGVKCFVMLAVMLAVLLLYRTLA